MASYPCTLYDASAPLLSQSFHPVASKFPQSGSWSWPSMIDSGIKGAISVLSRYSAGGVDQYTIIVGQLLCTNFRLNERAVERLRRAISELKSLRTIGNMLHFGFGVDSIVRNLAATTEGGILVALCAAMIETFDPDHAALIFWELVRTFDPPEHRTPSPMQWRALMKACAGTLTETDFPRLAEHLMHLHPTNNRLPVGRSSRDIHPSHRGVSSPDSIAEALLAIGRVSTGSSLQTTIIGGADAGWLAAVAQFVFDLRVALFDPTGDLVHATSASLSAQVCVYFVRPSDDLEEKAVAIDGEIHQLKDLTELFNFDQNVWGSALVCSRVPWTSALSLTFGGHFKRMMELPRSVGPAIAAAGYIYKVIAASDTSVLPEERRNCKTYFKEILGQSMYRFAARLLPELTPLSSIVEETKFKSMTDALREYESSIANIKLRCMCEICRCGADEGIFEEGFCLVLLLETVITIVHLMTGVSAAESLLPMRSGIEALYLRQLNLHRFGQVSKRVEHYGPVGAILEFNMLQYENEVNIEESVVIPRLVNVARLFTGREIQSCTTEQTAISLNGIVVFLNTLLKGGLPMDPESAGRCTVVTGQIEMHGRSYTQLEDLNILDVQGMLQGTRSNASQPLDPISSPYTLSDELDSVNLIVQERPSTVKVGLLCYEKQLGPQKSRTFVIGPASLNSRVLEATGIVSCDGTTCQRSKALSNSLVDGETVRRLDVPGNCKIWLYMGSDLGHLVALMRMMDVTPNYYLVMQHDECLDCCVRAARLSEYENAIIISRRRHTTRKRSRGLLELHGPE